MAEEHTVQVIGKFEPVESESQEGFLENQELHVIEELQITNTDGNMQINTYEVEEEIVHEGEYSGEGTTQHVIVTEDGTTYIQEIQDGTEVYVEEDAEYEEGVQYEEAEYEEGAEYEEEAQYEMETEEDNYEDGDYVEEEATEENAEDPDDPDYEQDDVNNIDANDIDEHDKPDEVNPCTLCNKSFKTTASLKRHLTVSHAQETPANEDPLAFELCLCCGEPADSAHSTGTISCDKCDKLFVLQNNLMRHTSLEHRDENNKYRCCECARIFADKAAIIKHMNYHPLAKPFSCKVCNRDFTRKYHLDRHVAQTGCDGQPRNQFKCQVCNKNFSRKDNLREHLRAHAGQIKKKKVFPCTYCSKEFQGAALLAVHMRTHTGEKPFPCDMCPKRFPSCGAMKKHRRMHTGEKPYQCVQCKRRFAAKETLNRHVRTHTGDKPHQCTYCGKAFIQAAQLRAHIFHHTGENAFTCPHCNRAFNRRIRLTTHIKFVHEGAQPMECPQCDKTFYRKEDLMRHELLHSGEKPYECEVCNKRFAVKASLKLHGLTHRKEQPCSCDECGRAFIRQDCLMRHMRAKHRDVLENIMAGAEKRRLQQQLLSAATDAAKGGIKKEVTESEIWNELTLTNSIKELLSLLVDEVTLVAFGWPEAPVDKILDSVIRRCGHEPASDEDFDYINKMRENAKLLFTVVIDDEAVKSLLNNQTVDEVIQHVLRLANSEEK